MPIQDEISRLENSLRSIIEDVLRANYGDKWVDHLGVTQDRIRKWEERRTEEAKHSTGAVVEQRLLYYADFSDLWSTIKQNWEFFKPCFGDKKETEVFLNRLNELRNPTAHSRPVLPHEESLAEGMSRELRQKITIFRNTGAGGPEPEHFCRIEEVSDSYGHRAAGRASGRQIVDTRGHMTLRPGDVVTFAGSAVDPRARPIRWRVSALFRASGELQLSDAEGSTFDATWDVTEADIHDQLEIDVTVMTASGPHRYGNYDDNVRLLYRVLPSI